MSENSWLAEVGKRSFQGEGPKFTEGWQVNKQKSVVFDCRTEKREAVKPSCTREGRALNGI